MKATIIGTKRNLSKVKPSNPKVITQYKNDVGTEFEIYETDNFYTIVVPSVYGLNDEYIHLTKLPWEDVVSRLNNLSAEEYLKYKIISIDSSEVTEELHTLIESL